MGAFAIPQAAVTSKAPASDKLVAVAGRYYDWGPDSTRFVQSKLFSDFVRVRAFPLVIPFGGVWDQVALVVNTNNVTDGYRLGLYLGDPDNGHAPPAVAGSQLYDGVIGPGVLVFIDELITRAVNIEEDAGTIVWAYWTLDAGTGSTIYVHASDTEQYVFGSEHSFNLHGSQIVSKFKDYRVAGAAIGDPPPDVFDGTWTDWNSALEVPQIQFRLASL